MIADHAVARLVVQLVVPPYDWWWQPSCDIAFGSATIRGLSRFVARLCDWWYEQSHDRSQMPRVVVRSVAGRDDSSYDRSLDAIIDRTIGQRSLPLVARLPTTDLAIDILQSLVIARPRVRLIAKDKSQYSTATGDRSRHFRSVAPWLNRNQSYDP